MERRASRISWIFVLISLITAGSPLLAQFQRFRISSGSYTISSGPGGGGGGRIDLPARCIDGDRLPPGFEDQFRGFSSTIQVVRLRQGKPVGAPRPLSEATDWIRLSGNETDSSVVAEIVAKDVKPGDSFRIEVASAGIIGPTPVDVLHATKHIEARPQILEAQRRLDDLGQKIEKALGPASRTLEDYRSGNADLEWAWLDSGEDIAGLLNARIEQIRPNLFGSNFVLEALSIENDMAPDAISIDPLNALSREFGGPKITPEAVGRARQNIEAYRLLADAHPFGRDVFNRSILSTLRQADSFPEALKMAKYEHLSEILATVPELDLFLPPDKARALDSFLGRSSRKGGSVTHRPVFMGEMFGTVFAERQGEESLSVELDELDTKWVHSLGQGDSASPPLIVVPETSAALRTKLGQLRVPFTDLGAWSRGQMQRAFNVKTVGDEKARRTEIRHFDAVVGDALELTITKVTRHGDAILIKSPNDELVLIDSGFQKADLDRIKANYPGRPVRLRLVITHRDADHLKGLTYMLEDPGFILDEIVVSLDKGAGAGEGAKLWPTVERLLKDKGFRSLAGGQTLAHFVPSDRNVEPAFRPVWQGALERWTINPLGGLSFDVYRLQAADSPNDSSVVIRVAHKGKSFLLSSDASPRLLQSLNEELLPSQLSAGFMKWPHHRWFPRNATERAAVSEFLQLVNPHTVVISNSGANQPPENVQKITSLIEEVLGKGVEVHWTDSDGDVRLIAILLPLLRPGEEGAGSCRTPPSPREASTARGPGRSPRLPHSVADVPQFGIDPRASSDGTLARAEKASRHDPCTKIQHERTGSFPTRSPRSPAGLPDLLLRR